MMSAVLVSMVESTGAYKAASRLEIATPPPAYVLSRGIGWQGIGILLEGLFETRTGSIISVENVGLHGLTRVRSPRVVQISAGFMIFFSIFGTFRFSPSMKTTLDEVHETGSAARKQPEEQIGAKRMLAFQQPQLDKAIGLPTDKKLPAISAPNTVNITPEEKANESDDSTRTTPTKKLKGKDTQK